jgi:hypothetical protein
VASLRIVIQPEPDHLNGIIQVVIDAACGDPSQYADGTLRLE